MTDTQGSRVIYEWFWIDGREQFAIVIHPIKTKKNNGSKIAA